MHKYGTPLALIFASSTKRNLNYNHNMATKAKKTKEGAAPRDAREEALGQALAQIHKAYGLGAIMKLGDDIVENVEVIPTGSVGLNAALGVGGYPVAV